VDLRFGRSIAIGLVLAVACGAIPLLLHAAQPAKGIPLVGFLSPLSPRWPNSYEGRLERLLQRDGYVLGKDIAISYRFAEGRDERLDAFAAELVQQKPDAIITINPSGALAAYRATRTIPIIFVAMSQPGGLGIRDLSRPGGNVTGVTSAPIDLDPKRFELLKDAFPDWRRVAILARSGNPGHQNRLAQNLALANRFGFTARIYNIPGPQEYAAAFATMDHDGMQAVMMMPDGIFFRSQELLFDTAMSHHLPVIADARVYARNGAVLAYGISEYAELIAPAVSDLKMILNGASPGDIPVDQAMDVGLAVNIGVAKKLGLALPQSLLTRANEVIE
jgi:putative tryptophan/tyrosine transport system substrate-binding protein